MAERVVFLRLAIEVDTEHPGRCGDCEHLDVNRRDAAYCSIFGTQLVSVPAGVGTYEERCEHCLASELPDAKGGTG